MNNFQDRLVDSKWHRINIMIYVISYKLNLRSTNMGQFKIVFKLPVGPRIHPSSKYFKLLKIKSKGSSRRQLTNKLFCQPIRYTPAIEIWWILFTIRAHQSNYRLTGFDVVYKPECAKNWGQQSNGGEVSAKSHSIDLTLTRPPGPCPPAPGAWMHNRVHRAWTICTPNMLPSTCCDWPNTTI